jgi:hypothetical protein
MREFSLRDAPDVSVSVRRSSRARRISLRVSSLDGRVTLTLPHGTPERVGRAFAEEKARWLVGALAKLEPVRPVKLGSTLPVAGTDRVVVAGAGRRARLTGTALEAPPGREGPAIEALLRHMARDSLPKPPPVTPPRWARHLAALHCATRVHAGGHARPMAT